MNSEHNGNGIFRPLLVLAATAGTIAFNGLAAAGRVNGVTPEQISAMYPTILTPAGYAFSIWSLIYLGLIVFSIYQLLPGKRARFERVRSLYIFSCVLNCGWILFWHLNSIAVCLALIAGLAVALWMIMFRLARVETAADHWASKAVFGLYAGWVTAATLVNFFIVSASRGIELSPAASATAGSLTILAATALAVTATWRASNHIFPVAVAWALTAIAVRQSGMTAIVAAAAFGVIICLIAAISIVMKLPHSRPNTR